MIENPEKLNEQVKNLGETIGLQMSVLRNQMTDISSSVNQLTVKTEGIVADVNNVVIDLDNRAYRDFSNATKAYVIETWQDGSSWYRKWSDGWVEQGGNSIASNVTVTLLVPMASSNYSLIASSTHLNSTSSDASAYIQAGLKTPTSFYVRARYNTNSYTDLTDWKVEGWKA